MIRDQIRQWIEGPGSDQQAYDDAVEALYRAVIQLAHGQVRFSGQQSEDLASEFLLYLRVEGNMSIATIGGLKREFTRFVTRREDPAAHELWTSLSAAIHELRRDHQAWRLDDPTDESPNHNASVWTGLESDEGKRPYDSQRFEEATESIPTFYPPGARHWYGDGREPRIISPANARKLLALLLKAAGGALTFHDLFIAAKRKVFIFKHISRRDGVPEPAAEQTQTHPAAQERLFIEAARRADRVWHRLSNDRLTDCLCSYFLPKYLFGQKVVLPEPTSTSGDQVAAIKSILATELAAPPGDENGLMGGSNFSELVSRVAEELFARCRKNGKTVASEETGIKHDRT